MPAPPDPARRLRTWLILGNVAAGLLVVALCALVLADSRASYRQRAQDTAANVALSLQQSIEADLGRVDAVLQSAVRDHERESSQRGATLLPRVLAQQAPLLGLPGLSLADTKGTVVAGASPGLVVRELDFFRALQAEPRTDLVVSEPFEGGGGQWHLALARRLQDGEGAFAGVAFALVPAEHFQRLFRRVQVGGSGMIALRSGSLRLVARTSSRPGMDAGLGTANMPERVREAIRSDPVGGRVVARSTVDDVERVHAYQRVGELPLYVLAGLSTDEYLAPWRQEARAVGGLGLLVVALLSGTSLLVLRGARVEQARRRALEREAARQRAFMQASSDGLHVLDREGNVVDLGDAFAAMLGYARDEMLGMNHARWDERYADPERAARFREFRIGRSYRFTTRHRRKDGTLLDVEIVSVGARIDDRDLLYCAARDVSERVHGERTLRQREALLDRIGRVAGVGGWELDLRTGQIEWSAQIHRIVEAGPEFRPTMEALMAFYEPQARQALQEAVQAALGEGRPWDIEAAIVTARGRRVWVRSIGELEYDQGEPVRLVGAVQDVTERRQRTAELERERGLRAQIERHAEELNALLHERSEMLDVLAHEVRQPLNNASAALQSMARALPEGSVDPAAERLARAQTVMGQVLASIDNTLASAALLVRAGPIDRVDADIDTLLAVAVADLPLAERGRIRLRRETHTRTASMDMSLMRLAVRNLLLNALKHSPPGAPVRVTLSDSDAPLALLIDVADQGPGLDPEVRPRLFERGNRTRRPGAPLGHGLGLYIVRRVMELHGGQALLLRDGPDGVTMRLVLTETPVEA